VLNSKVQRRTIVATNVSKRPPDLVHWDCHLFPKENCTFFDTHLLKILFFVPERKTKKITSWSLQTHSNLSLFKIRRFTKFQLLKKHKAVFSVTSVVSLLLDLFPNCITFIYSLRKKCHQLLCENRLVTFSVPLGVSIPSTEYVAVGD
jgi:hypothetical protein